MADMTMDDIVAGRVFADRYLVDLETNGTKPAAAIAGLCIALAATAHLAKCGPHAPVAFYEGFYEEFANAMAVKK